MNKKIRGLVSKYNFEIKRKTCYGFIDGYEVNVLPSRRKEYGYFFLFSTYLSDDKKNEVEEKMKAFDCDWCIFCKDDITIGFSVGATTLSDYEERFNKFLPLFLDALKELGATKADTCPLKGIKIDDFNSRYVERNGVKFRLSYDAIAYFNQEIEKACKTIDAMPNNYLKGILGLLIGGVAGAILTYLGFKIGFIGSFAPLVSICLGIYLYKKFGGKPNKMMIVLNYLITILFVFLAFFISYVLASNNIMEGTEYSGIKAFNYLYKNNEHFRNEFYSNFGFTLLFSLFAEGCMIYSFLRMIRKPKKF